MEHQASDDIFIAFDHTIGIVRTVGIILVHVSIAIVIDVVITNFRTSGLNSGSSQI